jgi:hypothetical protein
MSVIVADDQGGNWAELGPFHGAGQVNECVPEKTKGHPEGRVTFLFDTRLEVLAACDPNASSIIKNLQESCSREDISTVGGR